VAGVTQPLIADTSKATALFPAVKPITFERAVRVTLEKIKRGDVETRWSGAMVIDAPDGESRGEHGHAIQMTRVVEDREGVARDQRNLTTDVPVEAMWRTICGIGGQRGWYAWKWAWWLRGLQDKIFGGPGLRRGRRHPDELFEGEALDWWRVERVDPPDLDRDDDGRGQLRLRAEMKVPGKAWLQWEVWSRGGLTRVMQTAMFEPRGLPGTLYWYALLPVHGLLFPSLLKNLEADARRRWEAGEFDRQPASYANIGYDTPDAKDNEPLHATR
jgi:hypothetical protein